MDLGKMTLPSNVGEPSKATKEYGKGLMQLLFTAIMALVGEFSITGDLRELTL